MKKLFPDDRVIETATFDVGQDWEVPIVGFFIIGAKDKTKRSVTDFSDDEMNELAGLMKKVRGAMREVLGITDVYIFQNEDTEHGFHVWLFPRHEWMESFGRKIESVRPIMKHALAARTSDADIAEVKAAARKVREYLHKV
jgi:diadenosine tetraphosphate (Ap4A) HIT family hydrolase